MKSTHTLLYTELFDSLSVQEAVEVAQELKTLHFTSIISCARYTIVDINLCITFYCIVIHTHI